MEQHLVSSNSKTRAALVIGAQRFQAALLVEQAHNGEELTPMERAKHVEKLWPTIVEANRDAPSHARISKSHVLFTSPHKPMMRTGKVTDSQDRFAAGMDSLHAILLVRTLKRALSLPELAPSILYTSAPPLALTQATFAMRAEHPQSMDAQRQDHLSKREELLEEYIEKIDQLSLPQSPDKTTSPRAVVLKGSTGALGSYVLSKLLAEASMNRIYCLNRAAESYLLQQKSNAYRQLHTDLSTEGVTFCTCDLSSSNLGLKPGVYQTLIDSSLTVIHCAWRVSFNLSIDAFRPQLDSVVNLAGPVSKSKATSRLFFILSISSVMSYGGSATSISEEVIDMKSTVHPNGYAESKYISDLLLQHAPKKLSIACSIARVGQLAGAAQAFGASNPAAWFPSLVISSAHVGALPDSLGPSFDKTNWVPINFAADVIIDLTNKSS
ncbi:MAG: hypothetical protein Q9170_002091 [Blastenia crenularia]